MGDAKTGMRRREFVALGSATLLSSLIPSRSARAAVTADRPAEPTTLPIAYGAGPGSALVPAASVSADRSLLGRQVDLTVLGAFSEVERLSFRIVFDDASGVEYPAWSFARRGGSPNPSPSVRLRVPVSQSGLKFAGEFARSQPALRLFPDESGRGARPAQPFAARLSLGNEAGQAQLRRGVYVVALPGRWLPGPAWRRYEMGPAPSGGPGVRLYPRGSAEAPISPGFGYLILRVDTLGAPGPRPGARA